MRHYYFRLIFGIFFLFCMVFSLVTANFPFVILYLFLGGSMLYSAGRLRKRYIEKDDCKDIDKDKDIDKGKM